MKRLTGPLLLALACAACHDAPASVRPAARPPRPALARPAPARPATRADAAVAAPVAPAADLRAWPFVEHARRFCLPDVLARTDYLVKWAPLFHGTLGPGDPAPRVRRVVPSATGANPPTAEDQQRLVAWQTAPRTSHVMDCTLPVADASRDDHPLRTTTYAVYLPADYLDHPTRPRPVLMLVSGGNGNRTRWFLTPTSDRGTIPGTGGLVVRNRVDAWSAAHPDAAPPIVIGLDGSSSQFPNGMSTFIARELPEHVLATYLPGHARGEIAFGVESISSGAVEVARALRVDAHAFNTVGFLCPYTHPNGVHLPSTFGPAAHRDAMFRSLGEQHRAGTFAMRFSVGDMDDHYPRTWALYRRLADAGLFPQPGAATLERCTHADWRPSPGHCWQVWPGFHLLPGEFHNYHALLPSFGPQFEWELEALAAIQSRLDAHPTPPAPAATSPDAGVPADAR
jgi:hypothetical protein